MSAWGQRCASRLIQQLRKPARCGADHVHLDVVADVQHFTRGDAELRAGGVEDAGRGLGRAVFARAELEGEMRRQADALQVGIAVADRRQRHARGDAFQRGQAVGIELDAVALGVERLEGRLRHAPDRRRFRSSARARVSLRSWLKSWPGAGVRRRRARAARAWPRSGSARRCAGSARSSHACSTCSIRAPIGANGHRVSSRSRVMARTGKCMAYFSLLMRRLRTVSPTLRTRPSSRRTPGSRPDSAALATWP